MKSAGTVVVLLVIASMSASANDIARSPTLGRGQSIIDSAAGGITCGNDSLDAGASRQGPHPVLLHLGQLG